MDTQTKLDKIETYVKQKFYNDPTGHDYNHMKRVAKMAKKIALKEQANPFVAEVSGWLHDIGDKKLFSNPAIAIEEMNEFLSCIDLSPKQVTIINEIISNVSFRKGKTPHSIEGKIVQDSDRLDAMGAIGIARAFAFGGAHDRLIHAEDKEFKDTATIQHFYDKLLQLKDLMNTKTAQEIANDRHEMMVVFLKQFYYEWNINEKKSDL
ncbi:HD domain-containing protein [Aquibacillus albus]|uniref:HD domain-containing protein n=1 Tax=Aquibacillus albus TaxID=1168171 RepID=A0ABS2MVI1_9BACI|nr:HD domain-containing protein [Aquibacillus albus]MBM7569879.1 uncharacterized protein [Aquibacillus albus]